jgi:hypothetical protein
MANPQQQGKQAQFQIKPNVPAPVAAKQEPAEADPATGVKVAFRSYFKKPTVENRKALMIQCDQYEDGFLQRQIKAITAEFSRQ